MIRWGAPIRFDAQTSGGRSRPMRVAIETSDGKEHDVILKVSASLDIGVPGLMAEMLGSMLATDLGLPVNDPFLVDLTPEFAEAVEPKVRSLLTESNPVGFASRAASHGWRLWDRHRDRVREPQRNRALEILSFDAFIGNDDRRPTNPNLLVRGDDWLLIDHELAFQFRRLLAPFEPWNQGQLNTIAHKGAPNEHLFALYLRGKPGLEFEAIRGAWEGLSEAHITEYEAALPPSWEVARADLRRALKHLRTVRDRIDDCLAELRRVLS